VTLFDVAWAWMPNGGAPIVWDRIGVPRNASKHSQTRAAILFFMLTP
jgi:hypothetical protein